MIRIRCLSLAILCLAAFPSAQALNYLRPEQVAAEKLLPPPPADGSPATQAEFDELMRIQKARSPADLARVEKDQDRKSVRMFAEVLGPKFDLAALPITARLFAEIRSEEKGAVGTAKEHFRRTRPWVNHPELQSCSKQSGPETSYPSGHATMGYAMAVVLADLVPEKAPEILSRAAEYAENRLVCGQHYRRDIVAGEAYGTAIGVTLLANPAFRMRLEEARSELKAAGISR